jgi:hypothetical protein
MPEYTYTDAPPRKPYEEPGEYQVTVEEAKFEYARGSGNEILKLKMVTTSGVFVFDNLVFTEKAWWKIDQFLKAVLPSRGKTPPKKGESFDFNHDYVTENILGATGWVVLSKGQSTSGKTRNEVDAYLPPKKGDRPAPAPTTKPEQATSPSAATPERKSKPAPPKTAEPDDDEIPF